MQFVPLDLLDLLLLKHHQPIRLQIRHVYGPALLYDGWMFSTHQPSDVGEEEPSVCVVGIGVRVAVFVMQPVVPHPNVQAVL